MGTEKCIKFKSEEISNTGDDCSKSDSKEKEVVYVACRRIAASFLGVSSVENGKRDSTSHQGVSRNGPW